jgi:hypothetical protein
MNMLCTNSLRVRLRTAYDLPQLGEYVPRWVNDTLPFKACFVLVYH